MMVYFWYYWYKLVDLKNTVEQMVAIEVDKILYRWYLKKCHKFINKNYIPFLKKLTKTPFLLRLDTGGPIIRKKDSTLPIAKPFKIDGRTLEIPEDVYEFIKYPESENLKTK
jgi:hypothetical protein